MSSPPQKAQSPAPEAVSLKRKAQSPTPGPASPVTAKSPTPGPASPGPASPGTAVPGLLSGAHWANVVRILTGPGLDSQVVSRFPNTIVLRLTGTSRGGSRE